MSSLSIPRAVSLSGQPTITHASGIFLVLEPNAKLRPPRQIIMIGQSRLLCNILKTIWNYIHRSNFPVHANTVPNDGRLCGRYAVFLEFYDSCLMCNLRSFGRTKLPLNVRRTENTALRSSLGTSGLLKNQPKYPREHLSGTESGNKKMWVGLDERLTAIMKYSD